MVMRRKPVQDALTRKQQGAQDVNLRDQRVEQAKLVLEAEGFFDYAFIVPDETGNACVHTVGQGQRFLDSTTFAGHNEKADTLKLASSVHPFPEDGNDNLGASSGSRRGRRAGRTLPHRGRAMLPEAVLPLTTASISTSQKAANQTDVHGKAASTAGDGLPLPSRPTQAQSSKTRMASIRLDDFDACTEFLESRLKLLQQLPAKKIAKAWIKRICPKKQAKFPYSAKRGRRESNLPPFWPSIDACPFVEPDHIDKHERTRLLIHLGRLRPSPELLKDWNDGAIEFDDTLRSEGWTAFLQKSAGQELLDTLPKSPTDRAERRRKYLSQFYELLKMEEAVQRDDIDPTERYYYESDEDATRATTPAPAPKRRREQSVDSSAVPTPPSSSSGSDCGSRKKVSRKSPTKVANEQAVEKVVVVEKTESPVVEQKQQRRRKVTQKVTAGPPGVAWTQPNPPRQNHVAPPPQPRQNSCPESLTETVPVKKERRSRPRRRASSHTPVVRAFNANMWNGNPLPSYFSPGAERYQGPAMFDGPTDVSHFLQETDFALQQYSFNRNMAHMQQAEQMSQPAYHPMACEPHFLPSMSAVSELVAMPQYSSSEGQYATSSASITPAQSFAPSPMTQQMMDMQLATAPQSWPMMHDQSLASDQMMQQYHDLPYDPQHQPWNTFL